VRCKPIRNSSDPICNLFCNHYVPLFMRVYIADPNSQVIRSFNVLNSEAKGITKGMAHPGFFFIDESGAIREKYFEAK